MKKTLQFLMMVALLVGLAPTAFGQCTNTSSFGSGTISNSGIVTTISSCSYAGEYSTISGAVAGQTLRFTSSVAGDIVTIHSGTPSGPVLATGTMPFSYANTFTGTIYAHWNLAGCGSQNSCRTTTVQCTSCIVTGCNFTSAFGSATIPTNGTVATISSCSYAGEYSTISGAVAGQTLSFTSSVGTDYITIRSGSSSGPVVASGNTPLTFSNTFTGTLYAHWSTNSGCGTQSSCRTTTVQCTSCSTPLPPANDNCSGAIALACGATVTGNTANATDDSGFPACTGTGNNFAGVWYTITPSVTSTVTVSACGSSFDTYLRVFSGSCGALTCIANNDDFCSLQSQVTTTMTGGQTYRILLSGYSSLASGAFTLSATCTPVPVNCYDLSMNAPGSVSGNTCGAGNESNLRSSEDQIVRVIIPQTGCYNFSLCGGSNWDSYIYLTTACPGAGGTPGGGTILASDDDGCSLFGLSTISNVSLTAGTYYLTVEAFSTACGTYTLNVTPGTPPSVSGITAPTAFGCGGTANFSVTSVTGVSYTWTTTNGTVTSGQGTSLVSILWGSGSGTVTVTPSNACGTGASSSITVTCTPPPANDDCGNATPFVGNSQAFSTVFATGTDISSCTFNDFNDVWFSWTAPYCGKVNFSTCGSGFDTHLSLYTSCGAGEIACNDDFCGLQSTITANVVGGTTYYLRAAGYNGAQGTGTINLVMSTQLTATASSTNVSCFGGNNGSASVSAAGGSGVYSYSWSNGATTSSVSGLTAGTYTVVVTDGYGCSVSNTVTVTEPTALGGNLLPQVYVGGVNVSCNGASDGSIYADITGGTAPYAFSWSNGATTQMVSGLTAGSYTVNVTDANGCTFSASITLTEPAPMANTISAATFSCGYNVSCNGATDGSINLTVTGGSGNYAFSWSNGATTEDLSGLAAGTYSVTAVDQNGCSTSATITLSQPALLTASLNASVFACGYNIGCAGGSNGTLAAAVSGGCAPYTYVWSTGGIGSNLNGISAGMYSVTVTDANGCQAFATKEMTQPAPVTVSCSGNTTVYYGWPGSDCATITASGIGGGCAPYSILWSNGATTASTTVCPSASTDYTVTVTDANGCTASCTVRVCVNDVRCGNNLQKITICHNPPGNAQTLCVAPSAVQSHLTNHGDHLGACGTNVPCTGNLKTNGSSAAAAMEATAVEMAAFPNPFTSTTTLRFTVPTDDNVTLTVYAMDGRNMGNIFEGSVHGGKTYDAEFKAAGAADGIYFAKLTTANGSVSTMKLVLVK